jgi:flagellar motility protein MotE (MotC chaperone)
MRLLTENGQNRFLRILIFGFFFLFSVHTYRAIEPSKIWIKNLLHAADSAPSTSDGPQNLAANVKEGRKDFDVLNLTLEEFQLLTTWVNESKRAEHQESSILAQKEKNKLLKQVVVQKIKEMEDIEKRLAVLVKAKSDIEESHMKEIVKMFETMKPQVAAPIFAQLSPQVLLNILQKMKGAKIALILAQLPPEKAAKITEVMTYLAHGVEPIA